MTKYNVHIFREMRLYYPGIEAESHAEAAEIASKMDTCEAGEAEDCNGEDLSAMVDVEGDEEFAKTELINFEPQRLLDVAPKLLEALLNALPYVEDVLSNPEQLACFKKGVVQGHAKAIREAIAEANGKGAA